MIQLIVQIGDNYGRKNEEKEKNVMNEEVVVGLLWCGGKTIEIKKLGDTFVNPKNEIEDWVHYLNNPWSDISMGYEVDPNEDGKGWTAKKTVVVYDTVDAEISAVGNTPQEAVAACEEEIKILTERYCKEQIMDREKQIEEMAEAIFQNFNYGLFFSEAEKIARFVIEEQGYRKQGKVTREIFDEIEKLVSTNKKTVGCATYEETIFYIEDFIEDLAKLKKKYTGEKEDADA